MDIEDYKKLNEVDASIENIWVFPNSRPSHAMIDALENRNTLPQYLNELCPGDIDKDLLLDGDIDTWEDLFYHLEEAGKTGFIAAVQCPYKNYRKDSDSFEFTWGSTYTGQIAAPDFKTLIKKTVAWAKNHEIVDRARAEATHA